MKAQSKKAATKPRLLEELQSAAAAANESDDLKRLALATKGAYKSVFDTLRADEKTLVVEALLALEFLTPKDLQLHYEVHVRIDLNRKVEGDDALRRYLARNAEVRELCRKYRPKEWAELKPSKKLIAEETAKWKRHAAKSDERRAAKKAVAHA